jgi:hydroxypyruvate isomerase
MKVSITMYSFHRAARQKGMTVEEFIRAAGELGADAVDLLSYFWKDQAAEAPKVAGWLKSAKVGLAAYAVGNNFVQGDEAAFAKAVQAVKDGIEMAARLGAPAMRVFGGNLPAGTTVDQALERAARGLRECLPLAEEKKVVLAVENHGGMPGTSGELRGLLEAVGSPFVRACVDVGNFLSAGEDAGPAVEATADLAAHVHVKDFKRFPPDSSQGRKAARADWRLEACSVGEGVVPLARCFTALKKANYEGYLSLEYEGVNEDEHAGVRQSLAAMRAALAKVK